MSNRIEITVREAGPGDLDALVKMNMAMAMETENKSLDLETVTRGVGAVFQAHDKGFYLVAEADGRVVGSLLITYEWSDWRNATFWWVQSVYVLPEWRRRGVYRQMHNWVYDAAGSRADVCGIRLYVDRQNIIAQRTYASLDMVKSHYDLFEIDFVFQG